MSTPRKELPYEARVLIAFLLSVLVMAVWSYYFRPAPPSPSPTEQAAPAEPTSQPAPQPAGAAQPSAAPSARASTPSQLTAAQTPAAVQAAQEQTLVVENGVYRATLSNLGGVAQSWQLLGYTDSQSKRQTLDVVDSVTARAAGGWPLSIVVADGDLNNKINSAFYEVTPAAGPVQAPAEIVFRWSDGVTRVTKRLRFDDSYVVSIFSSVEHNGQPLPHSIAWRGGFGDQAGFDHANQMLVVYRTGGVVHSLAYGSLGQPDKRDQWFTQPENMTYAGIADRYFAAVFLTDGAAGGSASATESNLLLRHSVRQHDATINNKKVSVPVPEIAVAPTLPGPLDARLYVGPKDVDVLARQQPPMTELVDFGWDWIEPISRLLFIFLKWIYGYVPNWGWAIVLMTVAIITALYPLKVKSWRSMQKMQKLMPEVQQIRQRYSKYKFNDPRKQQEQQEMMAVYKKHGVSPLGAGGCLPMLLQMPIWFALYQMLNAAIELRHARWFWISDLSSPDPLRILPILMGISMYVSQKMTPITTPDPAQARMMNMMPIIFGLTFVIFPVSSGLVLYIFTSMLVGMAQQWYLNRTNPIVKKKFRDDKK